MNENSVDESQQASISVGNGLSSGLMDILLTDSIVPGASPSYEMCKTIYAYHPLGAKMAEKPVIMAQSQERQFSIANAPEDILIEQFKLTEVKLKVEQLVRNVATLARVYGVASLVAGCEDAETTEPLQLKELYKNVDKLFFNIADPLNTAGSLVLNQNPNAPDFQKPNIIRVMGKEYHSSRTCTIINEQPIYIEWTNSAFGFVGRSVYQRALYPMKSYISSMLTDDAIITKAALLVAKLKSPGSILDNRVKQFFGMKREAIKGARTGNVVSIGHDESIESIDLTNLSSAAEFARTNIIKNVASAASMPANMLNDETLSSGLSDGTEDAKSNAMFIAELRKNTLNPIYDWLDEIVMHVAWNPDFYATMQAQFPETYGNVDYDTAFYQWKNAFKVSWPNLLIEPDSEKIKKDDIVLKAALTAVELMLPNVDLDNKSRVLSWLTDVINQRSEMFKANLEIDPDGIVEQPDPETEDVVHDKLRWKS